MQVLDTADKKIHIYWNNADGSPQEHTCDNWPIAVECIQRVLDYCKNHKINLQRAKFKVVHNSYDGRCTHISVGMNNMSTVLYKINWN